MARQGELGRVPHHGRHRVPLFECELHQLGADTTGRPEYGELHRDLLRYIFLYALHMIWKPYYMTNVAQGRARRRLVNTVKDAMRGLRTELALLNRRIGGRLELRDGDLDLLELIARLGPMGPSALARQAAL